MVPVPLSPEQTVVIGSDVSTCVISFVLFTSKNEFIRKEQRIAVQDQASYSKTIGNPFLPWF